MLIREEVLADFDATAELNRTAFGGDYEADLIARLRADGLVSATLRSRPRGPGSNQGPAYGGAGLPARS